MPKQRDSSAALHSRTESSTDEIKNRLLRQTGRRSDLGTPGIATGETSGAQPSSRRSTQKLQRVCRRSPRTISMEKNSGPGPESEDPCTPLLLRGKIQPPRHRHPGILNGGKTVSSRGYSGHEERTITRHGHLLQPTPKERTTTNTERTYPKDVIITININGCEANLNSKVTQDITKSRSSKKIKL